ncbi:uncharacterized protein BX663DRAFT_501896, partial [Cokeromyces recurvatus]|uniref:uncharacterized protein n=1 Tax=Cokeromyces recurvatus TaxID=90255 RepID=UPI00221E6D60
MLLIKVFLHDKPFSSWNVYNNVLLFNATYSYFLLILFKSYSLPLIFFFYVILYIQRALITAFVLVSSLTRSWYFFFF